jgi:hypothetical protein
MQSTNDPKPTQPLRVMLTTSQWPEVYDRIKDLVESGVLNLSFDSGAPLPLPVSTSDGLLKALQEIDESEGLSEIDIENWHRWKAQQA